jgi:DNA-binding GntR family transcriptional regulator
MLDKKPVNNKKPSKALYRDLADQLQGYIQSGYWKVGNIIPTESQICEQFSVSPSTVKKTLEYLTQNGYLERRAGKGTWAVDHYQDKEIWVVDGIRPLYPFPELIHVEVFSQETIVNDRSDPILAAFESEKVLSRIKMVRWLDQTPLNLAHVYMRPPDAERVLTELNPQTDIYLVGILERLTGKIVDRVQETYEAILAVGEIADRLQIAAGSPLMLSNRLVMDEQGGLMLGSRLHMRTDIQKMEMSRKRTIAPKRLRN